MHVDSQWKCKVLDRKCGPTGVLSHTIRGSFGCCLAVVELTLGLVKTGGSREVCTNIRKLQGTRSSMKRAAGYLGYMA